MKSDHAILLLCAHLEVSPSGDYDWQKRRTTPGPRAVQDQILTQQIAAIHGHSRNTYGSPRIAATLRRQGARHGRNRITRLRREAGLCGRLTPNNATIKKHIANIGEKPRSPTRKRHHT